MHVDRLRRFIPEGGEKYEVIVAGGGPAGLGAAWAAARQGARTLLLEARSFFGGVAQLGLWMPMNRMFDRGNSRGGVHEAFINILEAFGPDACVPGIENNIAKDGLDIHPDYLRPAAYELLEQVGCHYRLLSPVTGVIGQHGGIAGVEVVGKDGLRRFFADVVVDCTGDGDVAYHAGVPMEKGGADGRMMPTSLSFALSNVDADAVLEDANTPERREEFHQIIRQAHREGYSTAEWYFFDRTTVPGTVSVNNGGPRETWAGMLDGTRVQDLVLADRLGVRIAVDFVRIARDKKLRGMEQCSLMRVSPHPGVRETRRMVGEYVLGAEDVIKGTEFEDTVLLRYANQIDSQNLEIHQETTYAHEFPYRCLLPAEVDGLLVAGRCASLSQVAHAAARSMGNMMGMGQAAGVAAALAAEHSVRPRDVDVPEVQRRLTGMDVDIGRTA